MSESRPPCRVSFTGAAKEQIAALAKATRQAGTFELFTQILRDAEHVLEEKPSVWGDPERQLHNVAGTVYHGILRSVFLRYVYFPETNAVVVLQLKIVGDLR